MTEFEYIVVGNGLFGSAATRYLSQESKDVAVIGPNEPEDELTHDGVYSSHYDERRLVRLLGRSAIRSKIGMMAMDNYRMLEDRSGILFYEPVGYLIVNSDEVLDNNLEPTRDMARTLNIAHTFYEKGDRSWRKTFPEFDFPETHWIIHEPSPAGVIDPRAMLRAQNIIAQQQGATIIPEIVVALKENSDCVQVETRSGKHYRARKVLVTAGAFTNCFDLFARKLPLQAETESIVLARVSSTEANRLSGMPAIAYFIDGMAIQDIYMAPPVRYADGNYYIKMGANTPADYHPNSLKEIQDWFRNGDSDVYLSDYEQALRTILPGVEFLSFHTKRCIITHTLKKYPIIDRITDRTYVASGAHGSGARSADTFGKLAAGITIDGRWLPGIPRDLFRAG
jgi:sarcosine oxidase